MIIIYLILKKVINMIKIKKFNEINVIPNSLIVFDIDDTLIKFDGIDQKWWINKINKHFKITQNDDFADYLAHKDWCDLVSKINPEIVDEEIHEFIEFVKQKNCEIILLTARNSIMKDITKKHLETVNLYFDENNIYFNGNKGEELFKIVHEKYNYISNIIMIDDIENNLEDIKEKMLNTKFNVYLYNIKF